MAKQKPSSASSKKVGTAALVALVVSAMIGGGIFNLPQNMAMHAGVLGQLLAWLLTGIGMWLIATTFRILAAEKPTLTDGIYTYASKGFGKVAAFFIAYGYWIYNCFSIVAYGTLIMATLNSFFPGVFGEGNNWLSVILASGISWFICWLCTRGIQENAFINLIGTIAKVIPVFIFILTMLIFFKGSLFIENLTAAFANGESVTFNLSAIFSEASSSLLVTLWAFLGIEGAVVISANAKSQNDVSKATILGFLFTLFLYVLVSILPFGVSTQAELAALETPSMGALMASQVGTWGSVLINVGVILSVSFAWLVWILMLSQMPLYAAKDHTFPARFATQNAQGAPSFSILISGCIAQVLFLLTPFISGTPWNELISITGVMSMPCYLLCTAFLWKCATQKQSWQRITYRRPFALFVGIAATCFSVFLVISGGLTYLMLACAVYALGIPLLLVAKKEQGRAVFSSFSLPEKTALICICIAGVCGVIFSATSGFFAM